MATCTMSRCTSSEKTPRSDAVAADGVRLHLDAGGHRRGEAGRVEGDVDQGAGRVAGGVEGVALHAAAVRATRLPSVEGEGAGAGVDALVARLGDEHAVALDHQVGAAAGVLGRALVEVGAGARRPGRRGRPGSGWCRRGRRRRRAAPVSIWLRVSLKTVVLALKPTVLALAMLLPVTSSMVWLARRPLMPAKRERSMVGPFYAALRRWWSGWCWRGRGCVVATDDGRAERRPASVDVEDGTVGTEGDAGDEPASVAPASSRSR